MKEWIKKFLILILIFGIFYIIFSKTINIDENVQVPKGKSVVTIANKNLAVSSLSIIGVCTVIEVYTVIKYINKTVSPDTFKINLIKLIVITVSVIVVCALCYYIYLITSATRFQIM